MGNFYEDNDDLRFYLEQGIDWEELVHLTEYAGRAPDALSATDAKELFTDVLRMVGEFSAEVIAPAAPALDKNKPKLVDGEVVHSAQHQEIYEAIKQLELYGMCVPRELGGMNMPLTLSHMTVELFARADVSVCAYQGFHGGIALAALMYSILEGTTEFDLDKGQIKSTRFEQAISEIISGATWGSMDITEPHAGSDMANLRAKGEQDDDGNWFVTGPKTFITSGDGKWHFVIARTEAAGDPNDPFAGLGGLSMFLVPAFELGPDGNKVRTHTTIDSVETKLGHNGSATVGISFERAPAELIGKRGDGFKYMLLLMNSARVGVGFESLGLSVSAYEMARAYAAERPSMGKTIDKHEMIADYLDKMRTEIQAVRALAVGASVYEETAQKLDLALTLFPPADEGEKKAMARRLASLKRKSRHLTPLLKYFASEAAVEHARLNIQIHGGAGYMTEYGAEKLLRDAMVFPIYEGTSQIQALMAMKDNLMAVVKDPARFARTAAKTRWRAVSARDPLERRTAKLETVQQASIQFLLTRLAASKVKELRGQPIRDWTKALAHVDPKRDFALAMLHAERLIRILIDVAVAKELLGQAQEFPERREVLERWLERAEPRTRFLHDEITTTGPRLLASLEEPGAAHSQAAK